MNIGSFLDCYFSTIKLHICRFKLEIQQIFHKSVIRIVLMMFQVARNLVIMTGGER